MHPAHLFTGNYKAYTQQRRDLLVTLQREYDKQQKEIEHQEAVIEKLQSFNREKSIKRAESRKKVLDKMERVEMPVVIEGGMNLTLEPNFRSGNDVLDVDNLAKGFDGIGLFDHLSFHVSRQDRVAILGDNGTGKTTMLKIINGITKADAGTVKIGSNVTIGYYDQEQQNLDESNTLFQELQNAYPNLDNTKVRSVLATFRFQGDDVFKRISDLSGGERGRVSLAKLMLSGANFLILDEPTNHLDMESKEILEDALNAYTGTILYVSHDRYFINQTAQRILEINAHGLIEYLGNYDYYMEKKTALADANLTTSVSSNNGKLSSDSTSSNQMSEGVIDYAEQKKRKAARKKVEKALADAETKISDFEEKIAVIDLKFEDPEIQKNSSKLNELTAEREKIQANLDQIYNEWEDLSMELESLPE